VLRLRYYAVMRLMGVVLTVLAVLFLHADFAFAEDIVDALEKDLQDLKQTHQEMSAQNMSDFLSQTLAASQSADVALDQCRMDRPFKHNMRVRLRAKKRPGKRRTPPSSPIWPWWHSSTVDCCIMLPFTSLTLTKKD